MTLCEPTAAFLSKGRRYTLYLWKRGKLRFTRLPSGAGLYSYVQNERPLGLILPSGEGFRLMGQDPVIGWYIASCFMSFQPVGYGQLWGKIREAEALTEDISALSNQQLIERFGDVPVAPEDGYSSGQCWYGTKAWAEVFFGKPAPTVRELLEALPEIPHIERGAFRSSAIYAAAYVVGDNPALKRGVGAEDIALAVAEGRKADGSGAGRLARLNAPIHQHGQSGQKIGKRNQ